MKTPSEVLTVWSNAGTAIQLITVGLQVAVGLTDSWACPLLHVLGVCAGEVFLPNCDAFFEGIMHVRTGRACLWRTACGGCNQDAEDMSSMWPRAWRMVAALLLACDKLADVAAYVSAWCATCWHSRCMVAQRLAQSSMYRIPTCMCYRPFWLIIFFSYDVCWNSRTTLPSCSRASGLKCHQEEPTTCISRKRVSDMLMTWCLPWLCRCRSRKVVFVFHSSWQDLCVSKTCVSARTCHTCRTAVLLKQEASIINENQVKANQCCCWCWWPRSTNLGLVHSASVPIQPHTASCYDSTKQPISLLDLLAVAASTSGFCCLKWSLRFIFYCEWSIRQVILICMPQ